MEYKYYLSLLNEKDKTLYNFIYNQITECADSFEVDSSVQSVHRVIKAIIRKHSIFSWEKWSF